MNDKLLTLLGFAAKAGKLAYGMNAAVTQIKVGKSKLVLVCADISAKSRKEITFHCDKADVKILYLDSYDQDTVSGAVGRRCGILSVGDSIFADAMLGRNC